MVLLFAGDATDPFAGSRVGLARQITPQAFDCETALLQFSRYRFGCVILEPVAIDSRLPIRLDDDELVEPVRKFIEIRFGLYRLTFHTMLSFSQAAPISWANFPLF